MSNMTSHTGGVVDPSIFPELTEEEQAYAAADPHADESSDELPTEVIAPNHGGNTEPVSTGFGPALAQVSPEDVAGSPAPIGHNQVSTPEEMRRDFFKDVNKFGKASGEGASALGRLGIRALRAAADNILSTAKPAGGGKDDATLVYEAYAAMDSKHAEHTAGGAKANASKLRQIIGMGCMTTLSDPVAVGDRVVRIRDQMEAAELKPKALFAALVDVAREQQASDTELSDDAIKGCLTKTKADKTLEKEWEAINKKVEQLVTGEGPSGLKDQSEGALRVASAIAEHLKAFKADGARQDMIEGLMEHGYTRAMATSIVDKKLD